MSCSFVANAWQLLIRPIGLCSPRLRRRLSQLYYGPFVSSFVVWCEWVAGPRFIFYGDEIPVGERALVICNHIGNEWIHFFSFAFRKGCIASVKYVLKDSLKWIPVLWVGYLEDFFFIKRSAGKNVRDNTIHYIADRCESIVENGVPFWLVLFPEGTWLAPGYEYLKDKSNEFAVKAGYPPMQNVVFPRSGAFCAALNKMRTTVNKCDAVYDITLAYTEPYHSVVAGAQDPPSLLSFLKGSGAPQVVHWHVKRFEMDSIPEDGEKWCYERFHEKEKILEHFSKHRAFPGPPGREEPLSFVALFLHQLVMFIGLCIFIAGMWVTLGRIAIIVFWSITILFSGLTATSDVWSQRFDNPHKKKFANPDGKEN